MVSDNLKTQKYFLTNTGPKYMVNPIQSEIKITYIYIQIFFFLPLNLCGTIDWQLPNTGVLKTMNTAGSPYPGVSHLRTKPRADGNYWNKNIMLLLTYTMLLGL